MAPRKSLSPLLQLLLAAAASFGLLHHLAACHALHRQSPLTMSTAFPPSNSSNGDGTANSASQGQCVDLLEKEGEAAMAAVSSSKRLGSSGEDPLYKRGEAQRCLLPSHASLMRQQQQLGPDAGNFPCASKYLMTAAPPPATQQKQRQRRDSQQLPRPSQLELRQQLLQQQLQQKRPERQHKHGRHEAHSEAPSNIAFNWRDSSNPPSAVPDSPQDVRRFHVAAAISADSPAVGQREKAAADASNHTAAASGEGKQQKKSFFEALGQAAAAEAAALVGGTWDWSTWGIGGLGQSGLPAAASAKQTAAAASSSAAEVVKGAAADGGPVGASALEAAKTAVVTATNLADAFPAAAVARKSAETSTSGLAGTEGGASAASAVPISAGGPVFQSPAAAGEQQHRPAAEAEADGKSDSSKSKESSWWRGQTWTDAIGSFFQKLDQRIEDAQGMLSHSDLYEFPL